MGSRMPMINPKDFLNIVLNINEALLKEKLSHDVRRGLIVAVVCALIPTLVFTVSSIWRLYEAKLLDSPALGESFKSAIIMFFSLFVAVVFFGFITMLVVDTISAKDDYVFGIVSSAYSYFVFILSYL